MTDFEPVASMTIPLVVLATDGKRIWMYDGEASREASVEEVRALGVEVEVDAAGNIVWLSHVVAPGVTLSQGNSMHTLPSSVKEGD